jgi:hypothetical protein
MTSSGIEHVTFQLVTPCLNQVIVCPIVIVIIKKTITIHILMGDYDDEEIGRMMIWQGKPKYSEETCPSVALSATNPTCLSGSEPGPPLWEASD